jgi:antitoxin VapB
MNIDNEEIIRLVRELTALTGEDEVTAVTQAIMDRLDRVRRERGMSLAEGLVAIGRECAAHLKEPFRSKVTGNSCY